VALAYRTKQALTGPGGLLEWDPRDLATLYQILEEIDDARRDAERRARG
jgi:hypothetical protein